MTRFQQWPNDGKQPCIPNELSVCGLSVDTWPITAEVAWRRIVKADVLMGEEIVSADWDPYEWTMTYKFDSENGVATFVRSFTNKERTAIKREAFRIWRERRQFLTAEQLEILHPHHNATSYLEPSDGIVLYDGDFEILTLPDREITMLDEGHDRTFHLCIENQGWIGTLADLEKRLFAWAIDEGAV